MRVTLHLDTFDRVSPCAYATFEIDQCLGRWISTGQHGLDVPRDGVIEKAGQGLGLRQTEHHDLLCVLELFDADSAASFKGKTGSTLWYGQQGIQPAPGHWHVDSVADDSEDDESSPVQK